MFNINNIRNKILQGHALDILKQIPDESVDCIITSPPYWGLRNYRTEGVIWESTNDCQHEFTGTKTAGNIRFRAGGNSTVGNNINPEIYSQAPESQTCVKCNTWQGELGLEPDFDMYIEHLVKIFSECKRVLKKEGTLWVVIGDTYSGSGNGSWNAPIEQRRKQYRKTCNIDQEYLALPRKQNKIPVKSLCMIPSRFAISMIDDGWILRNTIIWHKPSCMPNSCKDRFTVDFEYVFFFAKCKKYYFEQQFEPAKSIEIWSRKGAPDGTPIESTEKGSYILGRNKRAVWDISTFSFSGSHFATFPPALIESMIKAGCPELICTKCNEPIRKAFNEKRINTRVGVSINTMKSGSNSDPNKNIHKSDLSRYRQLILKKEDGYITCNCNAGYNSKYNNTNLAGNSILSRLYQSRKEKGRGLFSEGNISIESCNCDQVFVKGIVLDPFMGAGTTGLVAKQLNRDYIGIELNPEYIKIAEERINKDSNKIKSNHNGYKKTDKKEIQLSLKL